MVLGAFWPRLYDEAQEKGKSVLMHLMVLGAF